MPNDQSITYGNITKGGGEFIVPESNHMSGSIKMQMKEVIATELIGKKGNPRHYQALGLEPPMKIVPVEDGQPQTDHPGLSLEDQYRLAIQYHLDTTAQQRQYDSMQTAISYRGDPNPQYAAEADALFIWRSDVWTYAMAELAKVESGARAIPTVDQFIDELPAFVWP